MWLEIDEFLASTKSKNNETKQQQSYALAKKNEIKIK